MKSAIKKLNLIYILIAISYMNPYKYFVLFSWPSSILGSYFEITL